MEYRTWVQGETFVTRMDYVAPFFQEVAYALAVEKLLGITDDVPEKATVTRVLLMELNRIAPTSWPWAPGATRWAVPRS